MARCSWLRNLSDCRLLVRHAPSRLTPLESEGRRLNCLGLASLTKGSIRMQRMVRILLFCSEGIESSKHHEPGYFGNGLGQLLARQCSRRVRFPKNSSGLW